jgi:hypothetical protein
MPLLQVLVAVAATWPCINAQQVCQNYTVSNNTDFGSTTRCNQYPSGIVLDSYEDCCSTCTATPTCTGWTFEMDGSHVCFPLASYSGRVANHPSIIGTLPSPSPTPTPSPQPTPPAWVPKIAACDMLYSPTDAHVSSNNMPMVGNGFIATQVLRTLAQNLRVHVCLAFSLPPPAAT